MCHFSHCVDEHFSQIIHEFLKCAMLRWNVWNFQILTHRGTGRKKYFLKNLPIFTVWGTQTEIAVSGASDFIVETQKDLWKCPNQSIVFPCLHGVYLQVSQWNAAVVSQRVCLLSFSCFFLPQLLANETCDPPKKMRPARDTSHVIGNVPKIRAIDKASPLRIFKQTVQVYFLQNTKERSIN